MGIRCPAVDVVRFRRVQGGPEGRNLRVHQEGTWCTDLVCGLSERPSGTDSAFRDLSQCGFLPTAFAASALREIQGADGANGQVTHACRDGSIPGIARVCVESSGSQV